MAKPSLSHPAPGENVALCSASALPASASLGAPEWVHLLPAGPQIATNDSRGPYTVDAMSALIDRSMGPGSGAGAGVQRLPIDECHAIDRAQPQGLPAPARGWIVALEAREDGLWGRVEWTPTGKALMEEGAYAGISAVVLHDKAKRLGRILRASLTNTPNLKGLTALHSEETGMDWKTKLIEMLGLAADVDDAAIEAALKAKMEPQVATQSQELLSNDAVIGLQAEITALTQQVQTLTEGGARAAAEAYVDGEIAAGRVGIKPLRDDYIALHMEDAERAKKLIGALPQVKGGVTFTAETPPAEGADNFTAEDRQVMALFSLSEDDYREQQAALGLKKDAL